MDIWEHTGVADLYFLPIPLFLSLIMLRVAKETSILFNDEYLNYQESISKVQERLQKDIQLLGLDSDNYKDVMDYSNDRGMKQFIK
jgi:hypothetical protein